MKSIIVAMLLAGGILLGGCADRGAAPADPNTTAKAKKKPAGSAPQVQERYGFAPIGE